MDINYDADAARRIIADLNNWEVQSITRSDVLRNAWNVTIGSVPRIVEDMLNRHDGTGGEGVMFPLEPRDGTAEYDESVILRRLPDEGADTPGIVLWGMVTCAFESRDRGTFEGVFAFFDDEDEGDALMSVGRTWMARTTVERSLTDIDCAIAILDGNGAQVLEHSERILQQISRLSSILQQGFVARSRA